VLDAGGSVKAFQKQDGAALVRFEIAYGEAFAALALNRSSRQVLQKAKEKPAFMQSLAELGDGPLFLERGGQLIRDATGGSVGALASPATSTRSMTSAPAFMPVALAPTRTAMAAKRPNLKRNPPLRGGREPEAASYLPWEGPSLRSKSPGSARSRGGDCISLTMEPVKGLRLSAVARRAAAADQE
jgi:heme-degrading protein